MTTKTWVGSTSTDWNDPSNWSLSGVPASGDDVVIGATGNSPALSASTTVNTITINGSDTLTLAGALTVLTVTNGITLSSTGGISGVGTVAASVTASAAAHITATGGTLEVTGTITDSGGALVLTIAGAADSLLLDAASAAHTVTFGSSGTLELNFGAALTVGTAMAIGTGTLQLDRLSTLTDASGVTLSTGRITGTGTLAARVTASGAAHITATGGTLEVTGAVTDSGSALVMTIAGATDRLLLDASAFASGGCAAHAVTFGSSGTLELGSSTDLTVGTAMAIGTGTLKLDAGSLVDASGVTISTGTITGDGVVVAAVTATGAATITNGSSGGTLRVTGPITDSGGALVLTVGTDPFGGLELDAASAAHTVTFSSAGTLLLYINPSTLTVGTLTVGTAMAIGTGTLSLAQPGSTLTDASGVTISGGTITGQGIVNAGLSGTGSVAASGGALHLTGTVASGPTFTIASFSPSVLSIENTATAAAPIAINNVNQTLAIGSSGNLTINGGAQSVTNGTIKISAGGQLNDSSGFTIGSGALLFGSGKVTGAISGTGIVAAAGGTLELVSPIAVSDSTAFEIANGAVATLLLDSAPGTGNTFAFLGARGDLSLANDTGFNDAISGLNVGTGGAKTNFVDIEGHTVTISSVTGQGTTSGTITLSDGAVFDLTNLSSTAWFANAVGDGSSGTDIFVSDTPCFCRSTLILTEAAGKVAVEELAIGDKVVTVSGEARPIKWIGRRSYDGRFIAGNRKVLPIRIEPGALADGVPARDLWVSPEHALCIDDMLVPAGLLTNGATIRQVESVKRLEYFHIELAAHDIILAEGAPAESYVDCDNRFMFQNSSEFAARYPDDAPAPWQFCAPRLGAASGELPAIRAALRHRAEARGWRLTDDPDLHRIIDGEIVRARAVEKRVYSFTIPAGSGAIWLASRCAIPAEVVPTSQDRRRLGVGVERIVLCGAGLRIEIEPGYAGMREGFHDSEGSHRWTDRMARLPAELLRPFVGDVTVELHLIKPDLRYPLAPSAPEAAPARFRVAMR